MEKKLKEKIEAEGNEMRFVAFGLDCYIWRHGISGHWCGYVKLPKDSKLARTKKSYFYSESELGLSDFEKAVNNIEVHGGITFCDEIEDDKSVWFGFDCAHSGDFSPFLEFNVTPDKEQYRDKEYVVEECKNLARQIVEITKVYK